MKYLVFILLCIGSCTNLQAAHLYPAQPSNIWSDLESVATYLEEPSDTLLGDILVCDNQPFVFEGDQYIVSGDYSFVLTGQGGCDSTVSFTIVNINPEAIVTGNDQVSCTNELVTLSASTSVINADAVTTYKWEREGSFIDDSPTVAVVAGTYLLTIVSTLDGEFCIDTVSYTVMVDPTFVPVMIEEVDTLCTQDCTTIGVEMGNYTYLWEDGSTDTEITVCPEITTTYAVSVTDNNDCEQIGITTVNVNPVGVFDPLDVQLCVGDSLDIIPYDGFEIIVSNPGLIVINGDFLIGLVPGNIDITLTDADGCIQPNTDLFVTIIECEPDCEPKDTSFTLQLCVGESFAGYDTTGIYSDTFPIGDMCDSIINIDLTILPDMIDTVMIEICFGESYNGIDSSGMFTDSLISVDGCDSIVMVDLIIASQIVSDIDMTICEGESFLGFSATGSYLDTLVSADGCDSVLNVELTVLPTIMTNTSATICEGETFVGYTMEGNYTDTLVSAQGCDSISMIALQVIDTEIDSINANICENVSFLGYTEQGEYIDTSFSAEGCLELLYIDLQVMDSVMIELDTLICQGDTIFGNVIAQEGIYVFDNTEVGFCTTITVDVTFKEEGCTVSTSSTKEPSVGVYPNPTSGIINIESKDGLLLTVLNLKGDQVAIQRLYSEITQIDISDLPAGIYFLHIQSDDSISYRRIVKVNF